MSDIRDIVPLLLIPIFNKHVDNCFSDLERIIPKTDFLTSRSRKPVIHLFQGTNRNAPCPCGSGKKYKKCCINEIQEEQHETNHKSTSN